MTCGDFRLTMFTQFLPYIYLSDDVAANSAGTATRIEL